MRIAMIRVLREARAGAPRTIDHLAAGRGGRAEGTGVVASSIVLGRGSRRSCPSGGGSGRPPPQSLAHVARAQEFLLRVYA